MRALITIFVVVPTLIASVVLGLLSLANKITRR